MKMHLAIACAVLFSGCAGLPAPPTPVVEAPFDLVGEKLFLTGLLNGQPVSVQFDTGAESTVISLEAAKRLGISANSSIVSEGATGKEVVPASTGITLSVGGVELRDLTLTHLDIGDYQGRRRDIVIGYDLLKSNVVEIDHDTNRMRFFVPGRFHYAGAGTVQKIEILGATAVVEGELELADGGRITGRFFIDNGNELPLLLNTPFVIKHHLVGRVGPTRQGSIGGSDGGEITTFRGKIAKATFGGYTLPDFPVRLTADARVGVMSASDFDGLLGNPVLRKFNITYDFSRKRTYWQPNSHFAEPLR